MLSEAYDTWVALLDDKYKKDMLPNIFKVSVFLHFFLKVSKRRCMGVVVDRRWDGKLLRMHALPHACLDPCTHVCLCVSV